MFWKFIITLSTHGDAERLASKFFVLKTKNVVTCWNMPVRKNTNYFISKWKTLNLSLEYLNMRKKQCGKKSEFYFLSLRDSVSHDSLKPPIQYARSKGVSDVYKCFGDFCYL